MDFKKKQKFSIRKLTLGTVSVFLGATLVLGNNVVEANEIEKIEQKSEEKVKIGYLGVDEKELNDVEKKLIEKKDIKEEVAKENDTYVVVYKGKESVKNVLPKTGLSGNILNLLIAGGLILCIYRLGKKKATLIGIVLVTTISGVTSLKTIKAEEVLKEIFKNTIVYKENSNLEKLDLDNFEYLGYIKDENIPTNTRLYKLVEEYKTNNLLEKEEAKPTEEAEQPKETPSVEAGVSESTVEEKLTEEVEQPKETPNVEAENSESTVEEKSSEETKATEEVEQPKETPSVEAGESKEETKPTEEVEHPKETPSVEEENPESAVEETPKEEANPTEEEKPKEKESVEEGKSDSTVEEKPSKEVNPTEEEKPGEGTNPAEKVEQPKGTESVEEKTKEEVTPTEKEKTGKGTNPAEEVEQPKETEAVEEKPSEETKPTEKVEQPKETESVEVVKPDATVEKTPTEETKLSEEVEQPKETESVEEEKPDSTEGESKEEANRTEKEEKPGEGTNPAEEVEHPKETPSVEETPSTEETSEPNVEEKGLSEARLSLENLKSKVKESEDKKVEISNNKLITPTEKTELDKLIKEATTLKSEATTLVNNLADIDKKDELLTELSSIQIPSTVEINDNNSNGRIDTAGNVEEVKAKIEEVKAKVREAESKKAEISNNKLITPTEKTELDKLIEEARTLKSEATNLVSNLEDSDKKDELSKELSSLEIPNAVEINDKNANGKIDTAGNVEQAKAKIEEVKAKVKEAESKKEEISNNKLITPTEKTELDKLIKEATTLKLEATDLVNILKDSDKKDELLTELSSLEIPNTVEINDKNANGKIDTAGNVEEVKAKIEEVKAKVREAEVKKVEISNDKLINPTEKSEFDKIIQEVKILKSEVKDLVNILKDSDKKDELLTELSSLETPSTIEINDNNANGKIDTTNEADSAEAKVQEVKEAAQKAADKKQELVRGGAISEEEKSELDRLISEANTKKSEAERLVNNLPLSDKKETLKFNLSKINNIPTTVVVNDKNSNGKIDTTREADSAEAKVQEAKEAANTAATKKQALEKDGAISEVEKEELDRLISEANTKKSEAERLVNNLPLSDKKETLKTIVSSINNIPTTVIVNDKNANGKIDTAGNVEEAKAKIEEAKAAAQRAAEKKQEIEIDGAISEEEKSELDRLISEANTKKSEVEELVNNLPLSDKKETLKTIVSSINNIPTTLVVNDKNANGKIDTTSEADSAESKVQAAKEAAQKASDKKQEIEIDGAIRESEKSELDNLIEAAKSKKEEAETLVNNLPISDKKDSLTEELYRVSIPESLEVTKKEEIKEELKETKIEFKNVEHAYLYRLNSNNEFEKVLSIDTVDTDLSKYKVKAFLKDANKNIWLDVKSINLLDNKYKVDTSFDNLVSIDNNLKVTDTYSIEVAKRNISEVSEYNSFTKLINAMKSVGSTTGIINGTYILSDNLSASEISVNDSDKSYLDNYTFMGTLMSKTGKVFSINDLKKPLFNSVNSSEISNISINSADVSVERYDEVGVLANNVSSSTINNVIVKGRITGNSVVGGIVGVLDNASSVINSSFIGRISSLHSAGGISSRLTRGSSIKNSYSDVEISVTARLDSNIGGITGELGENSSIENSYVKGIITNNGDSSARVGGVIGAVYDSSDDLKDNGKIVNVITFTAVNNGNIFIGNISDLKASSKKDIKNNYLVENYSKGTYIDFDNKISYINFNNANEKVNLLYKNIVEESLLKNDSTVDYKNSKYYKESHQKAYENMSKLLPFYDRYTIVREANKLDYQDNLNKKTIKSIQTFVGDELVKDLYNQKQYVDSILIHYTDGTNEKLKISLKGEFKNSGVIDYTVDNKNIIYHTNRFAKQNNREMFEHILEYLKNSKFSYKIFNPHNLADWDESNINKFLGKLYLEDNFENIKIDLENTLSSLIDNYDIYNYNSKEFKNYIKNRLEVNKNAILVGLNYLDRWYNFGNVKNNLLHSINVFPSDKNSLDLVLDLGSRSKDILSSKATDSAYDQIVSKYTGINNINEFIKESYINEKDQTIKNIDEWIKNTTKAYIVSEESKEIASANEGIFGRLSRPKLRRFILPLLTVKEKNVYAFFTSNSSNFGIYDPYIKSKNKDSIEYKKEVEIIEKNINNAAKAMQGYFDALYRILDKKSVDKLLGIKIQVFDSYKDSRNNWSREYGPRAFSSVKALAGPVNRWIDYDKKAGAYALNSDSIEVVHFSDGNLLTERGLSTLSHEHVHNLDSKVLLGGYGRRFGHGAESFAMGLLQSPYVASQSLGINLVYEVSDSDRYLLTHNSSPKRFQNTDDLQQYMRGVFDVLYTLDLAEAEVILEEGNEYIGENYKILTAEKEIGNANKDIIKRISGTPNVKTLNDLIDSNIIGPEPASKEYANNDYININMFNANYGINENPDHTSGGFTFRRVAFELLAEKGYYDGMLPYISNKYYYTEKNTDNEKTNSDTYILKKIFNNQYNSYKDFRKDMFAKRDSRKNDIKSVTVWGIRGNNRVTINSYNDLKNLIRRAIRTNNRNTLLNIKQSIYHEYLILTNEFRESIYKQN